MAIKLDKPNFEIQLNFNNATMINHAAIIADENKPLSTESQSTMQNINTSGRFAELIDNGISPLKAMIIATTEFLPIATGEAVSTDVTSINLNFGEDESISVTNVARLMELHRQIREYTLSVSSQFLSIALGLNNSERQLKIFMQSLYTIMGIQRNFNNDVETISLTSNGLILDDFIDSNNPNVATTVNNLFNHLKSNPTVEVTLNNSEPEVIEEVADSNLAVVGPTVASLTIDFSETLNNLEYTVTIRSLIEYILYDEIILEIIRHLSGITQLKYVLRNAFHIAATRWPTNKEFNSSMQDINSLMNKFLTAAREKETWFNNQGGGGSYGAATNATGTEFYYYLFYNDKIAVESENMGSSTLLTNFVVSLANDILLNDNQVDDERSNNRSTDLVGSIKIEKDQVLKTRRGSLRASFSRLKEIKFHDIFSFGAKQNTGKGYYSGISLKSDMDAIWDQFAPTEGNPLSDHPIYNYDAQGEAYSEMLAGLAFDSIYALTARAKLNLKLPTYLAEQNIRLNDETLPGNLRPEEASITNYLKYVLGERLTPEYLNEMSTEQSNWNNQSPTFGSFGNIKIGNQSNVNELGVIGDFLTRVKAIDGRQIPEFEVTNLFPGSLENSAYDTVVEAYLQRAIEQDDLNLNDLVNLTERYATVMEFFSEDILKLTNVLYGHFNFDDKSDLTPLGGLTPSRLIEKLCYDIGHELLSIDEEDYKSQHDEGEDPYGEPNPYFGIGLLAENDWLKNSFRSEFFGQLCSGALIDLFARPGFEPSGLSSHRQNELLKGVGVLLYYSCEQPTNEIVMSFLTDYCNQPSDKIAQTSWHFPNSGQGSFLQIIRNNAQSNILTQGNLDKLSSAKLITYNERLWIPPTSATGNIISQFDIYNSNGFLKFAKCFNFLTDTMPERDDLDPTTDIGAITDIETYKNKSFRPRNVASEIDSSTLQAMAETPNAKVSAGQLSGAGSSNKFQDLMNIIENHNSHSNHFRITSSFKGVQLSPTGEAYFKFLIDDHLKYRITSSGLYNSTLSGKLSNPIGMLAADKLFGHLDYKFASAIAQYAPTGGAGKEEGGVDYRYRWASEPRKYGPVLGLSLQHRALIYHHVKAMSLRACFASKVATQHAREEGNDTDSSVIKWWINVSSLEAIARSFFSAGGVSSNGGYGSNFSNLWPGEKAAYYAGSKWFDRAITSARKREQSIIGKCMLLMTHAAYLKKSAEKLKKYIKEGEDGLKTKLAINQLKEKNIYLESLKLNTPETINLKYANYIREFRPSNFFPMFSNNDVYNTKSLKLMFKILTQAGYGLKKNEKKGGGKTVLHVGISNSMLDSLRREAMDNYDQMSHNGEDLDVTRASFEKSTKIAINIFKKNQLSSYELLYPKVFIFDVSEFILDNDSDGKYLSHIEDYNDSWNLNDIIENITTTRYSEIPDAEGSLDRYGGALNDNYAKVLSKGLAGNITNKDVMINHLFDYAFKLYYDLLLGVGMTEENFPLDSNLLNYSKINATSSTGQQPLQAAYDKMLEDLSQLYPAMNIDPKLKSEFSRVILAIKRSHLFNLENKVQKVFRNNKFERIFSILVNEKDFILHKDSVKKEFNEIFTSGDVVFEHTSKLQRPSVVDDFSSSGETPNSSTLEYSTSVNNVNTVTTRYKQNCFPDYPEAYNYFVSISLLPRDLEE